MSDSWTIAKIIQLKQLAASGKTNKEIGEIMDMPRNSIIGKRSRLGIPAKVMMPKKKPTVVAKSVPHNSSNKRGFNALINPHPQEARAKPQLMVKGGLYVKPQDHRNDQCRFPFGDPVKPGFMFCGKVRYNPSVYCVEHTKLCFLPRKRPAED